MATAYVCWTDGCVLSRGHEGDHEYRKCAECDHDFEDHGDSEDGGRCTVVMWPDSACIECDCEAFVEPEEGR